MNLFSNQAFSLGGDVLEKFFFSILNSGGHFVKPSTSILAILVEGHSRNIPVKLFQNPLTPLGGDVP